MGLRIRINKHNLDEEWVGQPEQYHRAAVALADAKERLDVAKAEMELTEAEVKLDIRTDPTRFGISKVTEDVVGSLVQMDERYQDARNAYHRAKHEVDVFKAAVDALEHRRDALKSLVHLHGQDYFQTDPKLKGAAGERVAEAEKRSARIILKKRRE